MNPDPNLLVGFAGADDAGVYRLGPDQALVLTVDFITPPVDDPYLYGQIAAANALSDVYAMGGRPLVCLNLACFPFTRLDEEVLGKIMAGSSAKVTEAGAVVAGGHTVEDSEPKFGLSVTGLVHPERIWTNHGASAGDVLILTRPIGSGVLFNANREGKVSAAALEACTRQLVQLNDASARIAADYAVHAATDISGFGLAGHGLEMARGSGVTLQIDSGSVPFFDEALAMYERGVTTRVNQSNRAMVANQCDFGSLPRFWQEMMIDPQTSGGLLIAVAESDAPGLQEALVAGGVPAARVIGRVTGLTGEHHVVFS